MKKMKLGYMRTDMNVIGELTEEYKVGVREYLL